MSAYGIETMPVSAATVTSSSVAPTSSPVKVLRPPCSARVRTRAQDGGRKTFTGELVGATDEEVTVAADTGVVSIPYADINRSNLLEG